MKQAVVNCMFIIISLIFAASCQNNNGNNENNSRKSAVIGDLSVQQKEQLEKYGDTKFSELTEDDNKAVIRVIFDHIKSNIQIIWESFCYLKALSNQKDCAENYKKCQENVQEESEKLASTMEKEQEWALKHWNQTPIQHTSPKFYIGCLGQFNKMITELLNKVSCGISEAELKKLTEDKGIALSENCIIFWDAIETNKEWRKQFE